MQNCQQLEAQRRGLRVLMLPPRSLARKRSDVGCEFNTAPTIPGAEVRLEVRNRATVNLSQEQFEISNKNLTKNQNIRKN